MDCASLVLAPLLSSFQNAAQAGLSFLWDLVAQGAGNHFHLGTNADALALEAMELLEERDDLLAQLAAQEGRCRARTHQVKGWLERLDALRAEVAAFESAFERRATCLEGCSLSALPTNYRLGRSAADLLRRVRELRAQRQGMAEVVGPAPPEPVEAVPCSAAPIVGGEGTLAEIRRLLWDAAAGIIGLYGMGGVGKTTLLTEINNELLAGADHGFDMVIWVTISRDLSVPRIQKQIGDRLGLSLSVEGSMSERVRENAKKLFDRMSERRKFLLLLDDVWEKLDLEEIGIPYPSSRNQCRIVLTTRSRDVCARMDAKVEVKVSCLDPEDSWRLFSEKIGAEVDVRGPYLRPLVEAVVAKCGGLPLALITVARAMAHAASAGEWEEAVEVLKDSPEKLSGMEEEVLSLLKFSFDRLRDETLRQCLLFCSLFPEDNNIDAEKLVEYWIGEGFLDARFHVSIDRAHNRGLVIIRELKAACLLENGSLAGFGRNVVSLDEDEYVRMHDTVREMCIWLTAGECDGSNTFLVHSGKGLTGAPSAQHWEDAKRISLMQNDLVALPNQIPCCPALLTLLINLNSHLRSVPCTIFSLMPALCILDLSFTSLEEIPIEIGLLLQLRYLNLSATKIRSLPKQIGKLVKLRQLILRGTTKLGRIPQGAILKLSNLQTLNLFGSTYEWTWWSEQSEGGGQHGDGVGDSDGEPQLSLKDVQTLEQLSDLGIHITTSSCLEGFLSSRKLLECTRFLRVMVPDFAAANDLSEAFPSMGRLKRLEFFDCLELKGDLIICSGGRLPNLEVLYLCDIPRATQVVVGMASSLLPRLRILTLQQCHSVRDLTWVACQLPCLEKFYFLQNDPIEELVGEIGDEIDCKACFFPKLKLLSLESLPRLRSISKCPLLFPALEQLEVSRCPELRRLPLGPCSAKKIKVIRGEQEWWIALEWHSPEDTVRSTFLPRFRPWGV
uniref:Disease resistance protein RPS2 n=1 Tax=Anthurium amnicola TaxID=1678845 RepID=A0A1D1YVM9_9ARAE